MLTHSQSIGSKPTVRPGVEQLEAQESAAAFGTNPLEQLFLERVNDRRGANPWAFDGRIKRVAVSHGVARGNLNVQALKAALRGVGVRFNEPNSITAQFGGGGAVFSPETGPSVQENVEALVQNLLRPQGGEVYLLSQFSAANVRLRPHRLLGLEVRDNGLFAEAGVVTLAPKERNPYLTGSVFRDANGNGRYDLGEGQAGVTVRVVGGPTGATYESGGYNLRLKRGGTFQVVAEGGGLSSPVVRTVRAGEGRNVRLNFVV